MTNWTFAEVNADHAANGHAFHVEAMAFRGATLAQMLEQAAKGHVVAVDEVPASGFAPTVRPAR